MIFFFICTRTFDLTIGSSFIYSFFSARPFDQKLGSTLIYFFICTRPFDQIIGSSFIYYFFSARPFDQKLGSLLIFFFHLHTTIRQKYMIFFLSFIHSLCTTIRPKNRVLVNLLLLFVHDHSTKLGVTLTLLFIFFLDVPIFRLLYSWQILPLHFIRYVHSSTTYIFLSVHYIHWSAVLIFRTPYPWLYEVLAECSCVSESRNQSRYTFVLQVGAHQRWVS